MPIVRWLVLVIALAALACASGGADDAAPALAGRAWTVTRLGGKALLAGTTATMVFADGGQLSGHAGCNTYVATYERDGERLTIGVTGATKKYCQEPDGMMAQESRFLAVLGAVATVRGAGDRLELADAAGAVLLTLAAS